MPELRTDWLTGRSVIVAENRALRPNEFATDLQTAPANSDEAAAAGLNSSKSAAGIQSVTNLMLAQAGLPNVSGVATCPFCPGNESKTPPAACELYDDQGQWRLRVVPNKFPALTLAGDNGLTNIQPAIGVHEVIVESARHVDRTSALSIAELRDVLQTYAQRLRHWRDDARFAYGMVFKNQGPRAGASIAHLHSQLIALPSVPPAVDAELRRAQQDHGQHRSCPYCRLLKQERALGTRIVLDQDGFVAFCPFASLQPHEVWLMPAEHQPSFELAAQSKSMEQLAPVLHALIARLEPTVPMAAYNLMLRTAPWRDGYDNSCHWRIELLPRVNAFAGLEIATGLFINPLAPERAASQLRPI